MFISRLAARWLRTSLTAEPTPSSSKEDAPEEVRPAEEVEPEPEPEPVVSTETEEEVPEKRKTRGRKRKTEDEEVQVSHQGGEGIRRSLRKKIKF